MKIKEIEEIIEAIDVAKEDTKVSKKSHLGQSAQERPRTRKKE